LLSLEGLP